MSSLSSAPRILPELTPLNRAFWTGGATGELRILRCQQCRRWVHPPVAAVAASASCGGSLEAEAVSGRGTIFSYTVNWQQFHPEVPPPYVIAIVELDEQSDLRIPTNIVDCDPDALACGTPVTVAFEQQGDIFVPLFRPVDA